MEENKHVRFVLNETVGILEIDGVVKVYSPRWGLGGKRPLTDEELKRELLNMAKTIPEIKETDIWHGQPLTGTSKDFKNIKQHDKDNSSSEP